MNNVICAIAKNEHLYINNWVKYNIDLGFDHIYLYDNDNPDSPYVGDCIDQNYRDKVTIFNVRGQKKRYLQVEVYNKFYQAYNQTFDWCAFIDVDEFIELKNWSSIKDFLQDPLFEKCVSIAVKWFLYGDDGYCQRDLSVPPQNFFKQVITNYKHSNQVKQITKGKLGSKIWINNHHCLFNGKPSPVCTPWGELTSQKDCYIGDYKDFAHINHYMTKTLQEFLMQKFQRGDAMFEKRSISLDYYWNINSKSREKEEYLNNFITSQLLPQSGGLAILVASCDNHADLMEPFHYCMEKYWPYHPGIVISSESKVSPYYTTVCNNLPLGNWTDRLRKTLEQMNSKYVLLMVDDIFIRERVDYFYIFELLKTMQQDPQIAGINLEGRFDRNDTLYPNSKDLYVRSYLGKYKTSVMCQLFRRDLLINLLKCSCNPWVFEKRNNHLNYKYLITQDSSHLNWGWDHKVHFGLGGEKWCKEAVEFFKKENIQIDFSIRGINE